MNPISPERRAKAAQVAMTFNSVHDVLTSLYPINPATGEPGLTEQLRIAHAKVEEANFWAVKSVLQFGTPPVAPPAANDAASAASDLPDGTESNATAGNIDPPAPSDSVTAI